MENIDKIEVLTEIVRADIEKEMMNLVDKFKEYVSIDHSKYPKWSTNESGVCTRINYGIEESDYPNLPVFENKIDKNYYCYLPNHVEFINGHKLLRSNLLFYNNKLNCWMVYDKSKNKVLDFNVIDTDSQVKFLKMIENILN